MQSNLRLDVLGCVGLLALGLGGQELRVDVGEHTTLRDDNVAKELVELLVVADSELQVTGHDTRLLVVTGSVTGELEDLGSEVLEDSREVDGGTGTDTLGVVATLEETVDTTDGDWGSDVDLRHLLTLKTGLGRPGRGLCALGAALATRLATSADHCDRCKV